MEHMLTNKCKNGLLLAAAALGALSVTSNASALALENPLGDSFYSGVLKPKIDMTEIDLSYSASKGMFTGKSSDDTRFTLTRPDSSTVGFKGKFVLGAPISGSGGMTGPGSFSFTSDNSMFGFGKDSKGKPLAGTVFAGQLDSFGWSTSKARIEFGSSHFSGWACAQGWCTAAERVFFRMHDNELEFKTRHGMLSNWHSEANGTAVIPIPASAWLLGSGLLGLLGAARRKHKQR